MKKEVAVKKGLKPQVLLTKEQVKAVLDASYNLALNGIPKASKSIEDVSLEYLDRYPTKKKALQKMLNTQVLKCTTTGFVTGLGGVITLPVTIPADFSSSIYIQLRMILCAAYISGFDVHSDEVRTLVFACWTAVSVSEIVKKAGIEAGTKITAALIKRIPGSIIKSINKKVGFRLITRFGEKGVINLGKLVPGAGGIIGGALNFSETKIIANRAYKWFMLGDMSGSNSRKKEVFQEEVIEDAPVDI